MSTTVEFVQLSDSCSALFDKLTEQGVRRFWIAHRDGRIEFSSPQVESLSEEISNLPDFDLHEGVFVELDSANQAIYAAFVHSTVRGQAQGGVRLLDHGHYGEFQNLVVDGLRLARGMTEKNAMAEIWWGGGKGIICPVKKNVAEYGEVGHESPSRERQELFKAYGKFIASIGGVYITAEDMNTSPLDMRAIHSECRFVSCLPPAMGGSSNPSTFTAEGVFVSLLAGFEHLDGPCDRPLQDKLILVQGVGNVGRPFVDMLMEAGSRVHLFDPNADACNELLETYGAERVQVFSDCSEQGFEKFIEIEADAFSPNAIGAIVTDDRIQRMNVRMIAGAANNQLKSCDLAEKIHARGIMYLPDFLINCMGIVNCANEQYGYAEPKIKQQVELLRARVEALLQKTSEDCSVFDLAIAKSKELAASPHPVWPGNGQDLIDSIQKSDWAN